MAQPPTQRDSRENAAYPGTPRWVKVSAVVALAAVLLIGGVMAVAGGDHGPGRHVPSAGLVAPKP